MSAAPTPGATGTGSTFPPRQPYTLQHAAASFVGRENEQRQIRELLMANRLVTLCGAGGVGKTRLALRVAEQIRDERETVHVVDLYGMRDPDRIPDAVSAALGLAGESSPSTPQALVGALAEQRLLLVLDNCEHLIDGCARLVEQLLTTAPEMRVLATSRQALGLTAEHTVVVLPLPLPRAGRSVAPEILAEYDAIRLFVERARSVLPDFTLGEHNAAEVLSLCVRLDGLPLALELAAVRLRAMSLGQILDRLDRRYRLLTGGSRTAEPRQRTLRALVDWSYDLCSLEEQLLWSRLSTFVGSLELEAAEAICSDERLPRELIADLVAGLVGKSVLQLEAHQGTVRYRLLETIAEYGRERLGEDASEMRRRHRDHYVAWAERTSGEWLDSWKTRWWERARFEQPNFRAALELCLADPDETEAGLRMASALAMHWRALGLLTEGRGWLDRLLAVDVLATPARAKALWTNAWLTTLQGELVRAEALLDESEVLCRELSEAAEMPYVTDIRGLIALMRGEPHRARELAEQAVATIPPEDRVGGTLALYRLAQVRLTLGDHEKARDLAADCMARCDEGAGWPAIYARWVGGIAIWRLGDAASANTLEREALRTALTYGDPLGVTLAAQTLAWIAAGSGQARRAARLLGVIDRTWRETGAAFSKRAHMASFQEECMQQLVSMLGRSQLEAALEQGRGYTEEQLVAEALAEGPARTPCGEPGLLTARERQIAELVCQGLTNPEIAADLVISPRTAETHVQHILGKLGFKSRIQIAVWVAAQRRLGEA